MISLHIKPYSELTLDEMYEFLRLRADVFVLEHQCLYPDIDSLDQAAMHIMGYQDTELVAYARIFNTQTDGNKASIGRVLVKKSARNGGYAHQLIDFSIQSIEQHFQTTAIEISAQIYLIDFYTSHGFHSVGEPYLEDGIQHINMYR